MKRLVVLLLFAASLAAAAEDTKLPRSTVMHSGNTVVTLPAGTVVKVVEQGDQSVTIKVNGKVGTIPWSALDDNEPPPARIQRTSGSAKPSASAAVSSPVAAPAAPAEASPPQPRRAQTMYGKAVEKARDNAASHEKAMVQPTDEILDGK